MVDAVSSVAPTDTSATDSTSDTTLVDAFQQAIVEIGITMFTPLLTDVASEANNE